MNIVTLESLVASRVCDVAITTSSGWGLLVALRAGLFSCRTQEPRLTNDGSPAATVWSSRNQVTEALRELLRTLHWSVTAPRFNASKLAGSIGLIVAQRFSAAVSLPPRPVTRLW
jgi:hypothetical protein